MKKFTPEFLVFAIAFAAISCSNIDQKPNVDKNKGSISSAQNQPPDWFLNQIHFDPVSDNLYGYGGSQNFDIAKNNAIGDLASFLSVRVSSDSESKDYISRGQEIKNESEFQQIVKTSSEPIILNGAQIADNLKVGNYYYVRIFVSSQNLVKSLLNKIDKTIENLDYQIAKTALAAEMEDLKNLAKISGDVKEANTAFSMLEALNNLKADYFIKSTDLNIKTKEYERLLDDYQNKFSDSFLVIVLKNEKLAKAPKILSQLLNESFVKSAVGNDANASLQNKATGFLFVSGNFDNVEFQGAKIVNLNLTLSLNNQQKVALGTKNYQLRGISPSSFEDAHTKALLSLKSQLKDKNLVIDIFNDF